MDEPSIFNYDHYQPFLRAWYDWRRSVRSSYSFGVMARHMGMSRGHVGNQVNGHRDIQRDTLPDWGRLLQLDDDQYKFLEALHDSLHGESEHVRIRAERELARLRSLQNIVGIDEDAHPYLAAWFLPAIRELSYRPDFSCTPEWVAARLMPAIPLSEARAAIETLQEIGYLVQDDSGQWRPQDAAAVTHPQVSRELARAYYRSLMQRSAEGLERFPQDERFYHSLVLPLPGALYDAVCTEIRDCHERVMGLCEQARTREGAVPEKIMLLSTQFLPLTRPLGEASAQE